MCDILEEIERADDRRITKIIQAVIRRYGKVFPKQEVVFLSLPTEDWQERQQVLRHALEALGMLDE